MNQLNPYEGAKNSGHLIPEVWPILQPVNLNVQTPLGYWLTPTPQFPPPGGIPRWQRLALLRALYEGDFTGILGGQYPIRANYFGELAGIVTNFLVGSPPTLDTGPAGLDEQALNEQLADSLADGSWASVVYGTAVFRGYRDQGGVGLESINTEYLVPARDGLAVVRPISATVTQVDLFPAAGGQLQLMFDRGPIYANQPVPANGPDPGYTLGRLVSYAPIAGGFSPARGSVQPASLAPRNGIYGRSEYTDMVPLVAELCRRYSKTSYILDRHANPILHYRRKMGVPVYNAGAPGEANEIAAVTERVYLDELSQQSVMVLPPDFEDVGYVTWDGQLQSAKWHTEMVLQALFEATALTPLLSTSRNTVAPLGGASLRKALPSTYVYLRRMRHRFKLAVEKALSAAAGAPVTIAWGDIVDEIDVQTIVNVGVTDGPGRREVMGENSGENAVNEQ